MIEFIARRQMQSNAIIIVFHNIFKNVIKVSRGKIDTSNVIRYIIAENRIIRGIKINAYRVACQSIFCNRIAFSIKLNTPTIICYNVFGYIAIINAGKNATVFDGICHKIFSDAVIFPAIKIYAKIFVGRDIIS